MTAPTQAQQGVLAVDVARAFRLGMAYCYDAGASDTAAKIKQASEAFSALLEAAKKAQAMMAMPDRIEPRHRQELCDAIGRCEIVRDPRIARMERQP